MVGEDVAVMLLTQFRQILNISECSTPFKIDSNINSGSNKKIVMVAVSVD